MFEALKKYAVFSGRSARKEFWLFMILYCIVVFVELFIGIWMGTIDEEVGMELFRRLVV